MNQIDYSLQGVGNYVYQLSENDDLIFYQSSADVDYNEFLKAKLRLYNTISSQAHFYTTIDSIFIYSIPYRDMIYTHFGSSPIERDSISTEVRKKLEQEPEQLLNNHWNLWKGNEQHYLLYLIQNEDVYVGAWVNVEKLITPFKFIDFGDTGRTIITTSDYTPINQKGFIEKEGINLNLDENSNEHPYLISGKTDSYIIINETSSVGDFNIFALIPENAVLEKLPLLQRISSIVTFGAILFLIIFIFLMRKIFLKPIQQIVIAMRELRKGNLDIRLQQNKSSKEFEIMNDSFNRMIKEIKDLKISVYERKINQKDAELKHLQLQINPHFFLNSLNIIYNLATAKEYGLIQEMSKSLANYFRFMFKSNSYFVSFKDEIFHTKNYLHIQQLRFPDALMYHVDIEEDLLNHQIPPLMIQSLVENSIKHAFKIGDQIDIFIKVWRDKEDKNFVCIHIEDTGEGFPEEILDSLQKNKPLITSDGKRIGIWNIKRRLELLYGKNQTNIKFANGDEKGAIVNLRIPIK